MIQPAYTLSALLVQVADEAAAGMLEVMQAFCDQWDANTWQVAFTGALSYLFDLPKTQIAADEDAAEVVSSAHCFSSVAVYLSHQQLSTRHRVSHAVCAVSSKRTGAVIVQSFVHTPGLSAANFFEDTHI